MYNVNLLKQVESKCQFNLTSVGSCDFNVS